MSKEALRYVRLTLLLTVSCGCRSGVETCYDTSSGLTVAGSRVCATPVPVHRTIDADGEETATEVPETPAETPPPESPPPVSEEPAKPAPESDLSPIETISGTQYGDGTQYRDQIVPTVAAMEVVSEAISDVVPGITLEELERLALANNPTIRQLSASASKASGIQTQSGLRPNPYVGYSGNQLADRGTDQQGIVLEQDFVLGGKLQLNQQVHQQDVQVRLWEVEAQRRRVLTDVRKLFYAALATQKQLELIDDFRSVASRGAELAEMRRKAQDASKPEVLQAEIQFNEVVLRQKQTQVQLNRIWRELAAVTGIHNLAASTVIGTLEPEVIEYDWDVVYEDLRSRSPELAGALAAVQKARLLLCRQQRQPIPNLNLQLTAGRDQGTDNGFLNVVAGTPVPVFNKNQGNIQAAYAEYCRATHEVRRIELSIQSRLAVTSQAFDSAAVGVTQYEEEILPRALESLKLSEMAYEVGEFGFLSVLIARRTYFESNLKYVAALRAYAEARAELDGLLLSGGLSPVSDYDGDDGLRGQALELR